MLPHVKAMVFGILGKAHAGQQIGKKDPHHVGVFPQDPYRALAAKLYRLKNRKG